MLRGGASSCQALARRLRLFAFEVFFLGTAMVALSQRLPERSPARRGPAGSGGADGPGDRKSLRVRVGPQRIEGRPARIGGRLAVTGPGVAVGATGRAQPGAVDPAQRSQGELEQHGVAGERGEVELIADQGVGLLVVVRGRTRTTIGSGLVQLPHPN